MCRAELSSERNDFVPLKYSNRDFLAVLEFCVLSVTEIPLGCIVGGSVSPCEADLVAIVHDFHKFSGMDEFGECSDVRCEC